MAEAMAEMESKSQYAIDVRNDITNYKDAIDGPDGLAAQVSKAKFRRTDDVVRFVNKVDEALAALSDERAVLKEFEWPEEKYDAMRAPARAARSLCASVGQRALGRGSRSRVVTLFETARVQAAPKTFADEILPFIPS
jgi:hypothetical protein